MAARRALSYVPGLIWGCWLLVLTGGGWLEPPRLPSGLHITALTAIGGCLVLAPLLARWHVQQALTRTVVRRYGVIGLIELAQNGTYLAGAYLLVESYPLVIPLMRVHTTYLVLAIGWGLQRFGLATAEPVTPRKLAAAAATVAGLSMLAVDKAAEGIVGAAPLGLGLLLLSTLLSAFQHFVQARLVRGLGPAALVPGTFVQVAVVGSVGIALATTTAGFGTTDSYSVVYMLVAGTMLAGVAFLARFASYTVGGMTSFEMAVRQELEYVIQAATAVAFLGAVLTPLTVVGALLVFGAAVFVKEIP